MCESLCCKPCYPAMTNAKESHEKHREKNMAELRILAANNLKETHIHVHFALC
jgi:hypothetical protein